MTLKDKINGNELDLSLNELTEVPVKELAEVKKATSLDLSCNQIKLLPNSFASLTHLLKIDLSKNVLVSLPENFGNLVNLQYLDLYENHLTALPVSFSKLTRMRWLDLKGNPLEIKLKAVAGDCLDEKQCHSCAKQIVTYMQGVEADLEKDREEQLRIELEREAIRKAKEEKELEQQRLQKKAERERRKAEYKARQDELQRQKLQDKSPTPNTESHTKSTPEMNKENKHKTKQSTSLFSTVCSLFAVPIAIALFLTVFGILRSRNVGELSVSGLQIATMESMLEIRDMTAVWLNAVFLPYFYNAKSAVLQQIHFMLIYISEVASKIDFLNFMQSSV